MNITDYDSTLNNALFLSKIDNIFIMLLSSIMKRDLSIVKHKITENIYNDYIDKVNELKNNHEIQMYGEANVKNSNIISITKDENFIIVNVNLVARYLNYVIDEDSKEIKRGINDKREEHSYELTFIKKIDAKPLEPSRHCPTCGANMDISKTGKCDYCGSIFNTFDYDYILSSIKMK